MGNNTLMDMIKNSVQPLTTEGLPIILEASIDGVMGQIASGLVSFKLSYKQRKFEENTKQALLSLFKRSRRIEAKLDNLTEEMRQKIAGHVLPLTFDYVQDEPEGEKIDLIINGFESSIEERITEESVIITYHDVLSELRMAEIRRLLEYDPRRLLNRELELRLNLDLEMDRSREGLRKRSTLKGYEKYVETKLTQVGLIQTEFEGGIVEGEGVGKPIIKLTEFGKNLINYFKILEIDQIQE